MINGFSAMSALGVEYSWPNEFFFLFIFCSEEKAESIAEYKDELEQTKAMVAKLRQEVGLFFSCISFDIKKREFEKI